jgi:hypothetical protein
MLKSCYAPIGAAAAILLGAGSAANAEVLTFDDIVLGPTGYSTSIGDYSTVFFANFGCYSNAAVDEGGFGNGVVSGTQAAFQAYNAPASVISTTEDVLNLASGEFTAAWRNGLQLRVSAYAGEGPDEMMIYQEQFTLDTSGSIFLEFGILGARYIQFETFGGSSGGFSGDGSNFIMDNLNVSYVPAPAGVMLLGLGACASRRRRRN